MASLNKVIIIGNLGQDPETRYLPSGGQVTTISVATTQTWKDKNTGNKQEQTEWHRIQMFNRLGEIASQYLRKGSQVYIEGRLRTSKYTGNDGIERYSTDIIANEMQMLGSRTDGGQRPQMAQDYQPQNPPQQSYQQNSYQNARDGYGQQSPEFYNDDVPF